MKKVVYLILLILGVIFSNCEYHEPEMSIKKNSLILQVGDSAQIGIQYAKEVNYQYSETRNEAKAVFEISDFSGFPLLFTHSIRELTHYFSSIIGRQASMHMEIGVS